MELKHRLIFAGLFTLLSLFISVVIFLIKPRIGVKIFLVLLISDLIVVALSLCIKENTRAMLIINPDQAYVEETEDSEEFDY